MTRNKKQGHFLFYSKRLCHKFRSVTPKFERNNINVDVITENVVEIVTDEKEGCNSNLERQLVNREPGVIKSLVVVDTEV